MASAKAIAALLVQIGADVSGLEDGAKRGNKSMKSLGERSKELGKDLAALGATVAAAGAALVAGLVTAGISAIDAQAKLSRSIGSTIDGLRGLQLASGEAGVSSETLAGNMQKLNARLGEAQRGTGEAKKALDMLGLSAALLGQMDADQRIATIADRVVELGLSSSQTADVLRNLGIRGGEMVDFLRQGGDAIRAARKDVDDFGLSVSAVDASKIEMANDAIERMKLVIETVSNRMAIAFAPILKALADRFNTLAKANGGFGEMAVEVSERIIMGFAKVADVVHIVQIAFKTLQLAFAKFGEIVWTVVASIGEAFTRLVDFHTSGVNLIIRGLNKLGAGMEELPSLNDSQFMHGLRSAADTAGEITNKIQMELLDLAQADWPSDKVTAFISEVKKAADEAAKAMAAAQPGSGSFESEDEGAKKDEERAAKELERQREALEAKLQQIREFAMTETELEIFQHEERMLRLQEGLEAELLTRQEYQTLEAALAEEHQKRLAEIRKKGMSDLEKFTNASYSKQVGMVSGYLADITAGVARENRAMFELNKAAGIANAVVAAYEGISKTLGAYPYPINIALAAAHAAAAFAQVKAIASQNFSSGGTAAPSLAGGTPATPVTPVSGGTAAGAGGGSLLTVEGVDPDSLFSGRAVRALADRLQDHLRDGGRVAFA